MFFVILIHSLVFFEKQPITEIIITSICFSGNAMFFMLSGKYNLRFNTKNGEKYAYKNYYIKKFVSIVIPFLVYCTIIHLYLCKLFNIDIFTYEAFKAFWTNFLTNNMFYHLWFMYALIGLLIAAPFLAKLLQLLSDFELKLLVAIILVLRFVKIIVLNNILGINTAFDSFLLTDWLLYFILGYYCDRIITNKKTLNIYIIVGVVCLPITILQRFFFPNNSAYACDLSPIYTLYCVAAYLLLERFVKVHNCFKRSISFVAKYSFSIYLLHAPVLQIISIYDGKYNLTSNINNVLAFILYVIVAFIISFACSLFIDNTLIMGIKTIFSKKDPVDKPINSKNDIMSRSA